MICAAHATNWSFPAILNGMYYPQVYDEEGYIREGRHPLPEILSEHGYTTAGIVASNVYLAKWKPYFDYFWNDGMEGGNAEMYNSKITKLLERAYLTLTMSKRAPATQVAEIAERWEREETLDSPRFVWLHLMEPHLPYYPDLSRAKSVGLLKSYYSAIDYYQNGNDASASTLETIEELHWQCVDLLDKRIERVLDIIPDDAIAVITGDHGEAFNHTPYGHLRLYDECVKVPFISKNLNNLPDPVRQVDLPAHILNEIGINIPDKWHSNLNQSEFVAPLVGADPADDKLFAGIRTGTQKLIRTYNAETSELIETELYDLSDDPGEQNNQYISDMSMDIEEILDDFIKEKNVLNRIQPREHLSKDVNQRLKELGYK